MYSAVAPATAPDAPLLSAHNLAIDEEFIAALPPQAQDIKSVLSAGGTVDMETGPLVLDNRVRLGAFRRAG